MYYRIATIVYYRNTVIYYPILYYGFHCCNSIAILESLVINRSKMRWSNIQFWWETSVDFLRRKKSPYFYREKVFWHINEPKKARVSIFCCCFFFPLKKTWKMKISQTFAQQVLLTVFSTNDILLSFIFRIIFQLYCNYMVLEVLNSILKWEK